MKTKTIRLAFLENGNRDVESGANRHAWRVKSGTDNVEYNPGQLLLKQEVDELCASSQWRVTIEGA